MRGLPRRTMLANQAALTRPGAASGSATSATITCVASSAVATPRCASTVARSRKLVTARMPSAIWTHDQHGRDDREGAQIAARPGAPERDDRRREHQHRHRDAGQAVQRLDQHGRVRVGPQRAAAERDVGAGEGGARVADQPTQQHLEVDRDRRDDRHARHRRRWRGGLTVAAPGAIAPRCRPASGRTAATSRCAPSRPAWATAG